MNETDIEALSSVISIVLIVAGLAMMAYAVLVSRDWMLLAFGAVTCHVGVNVD
jgi:hypothetical protein